ncbi:MAG: hypothetical protein AB7O78_08610 [Thermoleophilia bacterium]
MAVDRFDGWIAGVGTATGLRAVLGHWPRSPLGPFTDVMVERGDGRRLLLAPTAQVAEYVAATYRFDEVLVTPVALAIGRPWWHVAAGPLDVRFAVGGRPALGLLLRAVPPRLATRRWWIRAADVPARLGPRLRTHGSAGGGRTEWYAARDLRRITTAAVRWEGRDQGPMAPVDPPVRFGFGSTPRAPSLVRITTFVTTSA